MTTGTLRPASLQDCDLYFKRSYLPPLIATLPPEQRNRIEPLGLNYRVLPSGVDWFAARRGFALRDQPLHRALREAFDARNSFGYKPRLREMENPPEPNAEPRVLFLAATYDPHDDPGRTQDKIDDRISINETRARCIRLLKDALGKRFTGGFAASAFARQRFRPDRVRQRDDAGALHRNDAVASDLRRHDGAAWLDRLEARRVRRVLEGRHHREAALQRSGDFGPNRNYLEFSTPEGCAEAAVRLVEEKDLRERLMVNNAAYYRAFVRPDAVVANTLRAREASRPRSHEPEKSRPRSEISRKR